MYRIGVVVGEASGDQLGAHLIEAIRQYDPTCIFEGIAGDRMKQLGAKSLFPMEALSVMGFPLTKIPKIWFLQRKMISYFLENPPDLFIGIDAPDFNLNIELALRERKIPTLHYVSPSVWAWRSYRLKKIAKAVDSMLVLFPFEEKIYLDQNIPVHYVGHPLASQIPLVISKSEVCERLNLNPEKIYLALLPGSRTQEIQYLAPLFLKTAIEIQKKFPNIECITAQTNEQLENQMKAIQHQVAPDLNLHYFCQKSHEVMQSSDLILIASGTATLEAMLYKKPMVIAYRMPNLTYQIAKRLVTIPYIGLPNILAGKKMIPEYIQADASVAHLTEALSNYLENPDKAQSLQASYLDLHQVLKRDTAQLAGRAVIDLLKKSASV